MNHITQTQLRDLLAYNQNTGEFRWRAGRPGCRRHPGTFDRGVLRIRVLGKLYLARDLAWLYVTGELPPSRVWYKNHDLTDLRFRNLTLVQPEPLPSVAGAWGLPPGVRQDQHTKRYYASVRYKGRTYYAGTARTVKEALRKQHAALAKAKRKTPA